LVRAANFANVFDIALDASQGLGVWVEFIFELSPHCSAFLDDDCTATKVWGEGVVSRLPVM